MPGAACAWRQQVSWLLQDSSSRAVSAGSGAAGVHRIERVHTGTAVSMACQWRVKTAPVSGGVSYAIKLLQAVHLSHEAANRWLSTATPMVTKVGCSQDQIEEVRRQRSAHRTRRAQVLPFCPWIMCRTCGSSIILLACGLPRTAAAHLPYCAVFGTTRPHHPVCL